MVLKTPVVDAKIYDKTVEINNPANAPSNVLLGLINEKNGFFPIFLPIKYANISLVDVNNNENIISKIPLFFK